MMQQGIEGVTVDELARTAGVAKGSFYRYFRDKVELVETMLEPLFSHIRGAFDACEQAIADADSQDGLLGAYNGLADSLTQVLMSFPREVILYFQEARGPAVGARVCVRQMSAEIGQRAIRLTELARDRGLLRTFDPRVSALAVVGASERLLFEVLTGGDIGVPHKAAEGLVSLIMDGMRPSGPTAADAPPPEEQRSE